MQVTKTFASCKVFLYVLLYYFIFQAPIYWKCYFNKRFLLIFRLHFWFHVISTRYSNTLKYSQQYIWHHLSGTKVRIWICSGYEAAFNFSCIASCNLPKSFTFSFISCCQYLAKHFFHNESVCDPWLWLYITKTLKKFDENH